MVDCHLVRDRDTGRSRGFAFLAYEDQRSSVLAIDNLNGAAVIGRTLRVDHADKYRRPKEAEPSVASDDAEFRQFDGEEAADYDERRKRIWDFEVNAPLRAPQGSGGRGEGSSGSLRTREGGAGSAPLSYSVDVKALKVSASSEDANALRILRMWEERQQRKKEREEEERRKELQMQRGGRGRDDSRRFGDQQVEVKVGKEEERKQPPQAVRDPPQTSELSGKRGGNEEAKEADSRRRGRRDSRERSPRRSRSRSRSRERSHRRRERPRDRDRRGNEERSRSRDIDSEDEDRRRHRRRERDTRSRSG